MLSVITAVLFALQIQAERQKVLERERLQVEEELNEKRRLEAILEENQRKIEEQKKKEAEEREE